MRPPPGSRHILRRKGPYQQRSEIIERFISHWRRDVGKDLYPAFRLILPDRDNDRQVYGLKEMALGRLIVKILGLDPKRSEDARKLINWKVQGAGDFPGMSYSALKARSLLTDPGDMTIGEVNELLDQLSLCSKRDQYLPILKQFYHRMNAEEMTWLIRIILKQMKIGTGHEVFLRFMHEGAPSKWSSTSSLRTVCWTLFDETCAWDGDVSVKPFDCFQPQLCKQVNHEFDKVVDRMNGTPEDPEFWIQEKLDGERIQMHMADDRETGGKRFAWYSRNGTDYTYLYGSCFSDPNSSMTRYLKSTFPINIKNIILDGEMIAWDPLTKGVVPFGTLKTVALDQGAHPDKTTGSRPLFKVFDCLYCNDKDVTKYTLRDRRNLLEQAVTQVDGRMEFLDYWKCTTGQQIEERLRQVIAESSEGLVIKNPRSAYTLTVGSRSDAWVKVKPDYMNELGEHLDCIVIGAYYGSGTRGGRHSSFLCGLRCAEDPTNPPPGMNSQKCWSFVKAGGGYSATDYKAIKHKTEGKWRKWDRNNPPDEYIELAGDHLQHERPDEWIKPEDSVVIAVKATQVSGTDKFRTGVTLRFPRFKSLREDRDWKNALSMAGFIELKMNVEQEQSKKKLELDRERQIKRRKTNASRKKTLTVIGAGQGSKADKPDTVQSGCFTDLEFCVMTDMETPLPGEPRMTKVQLEELIKANGGVYWASPEKRSPNVICVADKKPTNVFALMKKATHNIVRPAWLIDCVKQHQRDKASGLMRDGKYLLPLEGDRHLFFAKDDALEDAVDTHIDSFGDSFARDTNETELKSIFCKMSKVSLDRVSTKAFLELLENEGADQPDLKNLIFVDQSLCFYNHLPSGSMNGTENSMGIDEKPEISKDLEVQWDILCDLSRHKALFGGANVTSTMKLDETTHVIICSPSDNNANGSDLAKSVRQELSSSWKPGKPIPRVVNREWVDECWKEGTLVDEDRFAVL